MASRVEKRLGKNYILDRTLGEGAFGKVKLAVDERTGIQVAIKIMEKAKIAKHKMESQVKKEMTIMKHIRHRNIVNLREILFSKTKVFLVMELCSGGELFDKLVAERRFSEDLARKYFQQLISALELVIRVAVALWGMGTVLRMLLVCALQVLSQSKCVPS